MPDLRVVARRRDLRRDATLAFVFRTLGVSTVPGSAADGATGWSGPSLLHGDGDGQPDDHRRQSLRPNEIRIADRPADTIWPELLRGEVDVAGLDGEVPFDLISAIGAFLGDDVNAGVRPDGFDAHGRLTYAASAATRAGFGDQPIVNRYVAFLGDLLRTRLGIVGRERWPGGRTAAIGLSHDVDHPDRYALFGSAVRPWRFRRGPRSYLTRTFRLARRRLGDPAPHDFWLFDEIAASEMARDFRSTFFFATVPFHHAAGAPEDVAYDVRGRRYRAVMRSLIETGFEVGLHASYRAWQDPARFVAERRTLGAVAGTDIAGVRHHYWQLGRDVAGTLRAHEHAGFRYDSSLAFNDHVGFRRGVALPFHVYDDRLARPLDVLELPPFCMDGNLFYTSNDVDAAVATVDRAIDAIVATGGMGSINWHIQTSHPSNTEFRSWGVAYQEILALLAARTDIWTTDLGSIATWVEQRDRAVAAGAPDARVDQGPVAAVAR